MFLLDFSPTNSDCDVCWVNRTGDITQQPEGVMGSYTYGHVADNEENRFLMVLDWLESIKIKYAKRCRLFGALSIPYTCPLNTTTYWMQSRARQQYCFECGFNTFCINSYFKSWINHGSAVATDAAWVGKQVSLAGVPGWTPWSDDVHGVQGSNPGEEWDMASVHG